MVIQIKIDLRQIN